MPGLASAGNLRRWARGHNRLLVLRKKAPFGSFLKLHKACAHSTVGAVETPLHVVSIGLQRWTQDVRSACDFAHRNRDRRRIGVANCVADFVGKAVAEILTTIVRVAERSIGIQRQHTEARANDRRACRSSARSLPRSGLVQLLFVPPVAA